MRSSRRLWDQVFERSRPSPSRPFCTNNKPYKPNGVKYRLDFNGDDAFSTISRQEAYGKLENLDFMTATKILFTTPPKRRTFGYDNVASYLTAVYLVAQYARSEMRRMEVELEVKKKAEEEAKSKAEEGAKAKEVELKATEKQKDPHFLEVKERLDKLEEALKEIVIQSKKKATNSLGNSQAEKDLTKQTTTVNPEYIGTDGRHTSQNSSGKVS